jgi:hypothetical protein
MEAQNILANDVQMDGIPVFGSVLKGGGIILCQQGGDVAQQGIKPDIERVLGIVGYRETVFYIEARDGKILQPLSDKAQNFIPSGLWLDKQGMLLVKCR